MTKKEISKAASAMGKRGYKAKLEKLGLEEIQTTARENGKLGGRPKGKAKGIAPKEGAMR
jgi:hypothetical protein